MRFAFLKKLSLSRKLILGFMGAILIGTLFLMMPFSSSGEENISFLTAFDFYSAGRAWYNDFFVIYTSSYW